MMIPRQPYSFSGVVATLCFFFLFSFALHTLASPTLHYCRHDQRDALLEFKHEFPISESNPTANAMSSWNKSNDCCFWNGVKCDAKSGKVISLNLFGVFLNNTLKPNSGLFKLQYLQHLILYSCKLYGEIPSSFGNLSHLRKLDLLKNELVGQVPASVGNLTQLSDLSLGENKLSGKIPISVANLTKLRNLDLSNNYFEELPSDISGLHSLEYFYVSGNSFYGPFPTSLFRIPSLQWVHLEENHFKGPIEFGNISSSSTLNRIYLSRNKLDGAIPESISKFLNMEKLDLSYNKIIGPIPTSISQLVNLTYLDLSNNKIIGPIPTSLSQLVNLTYLDLSNNKLEGEVAGFLWRFGVVNLSHNSFSSFGSSFELEEFGEQEYVYLDLDIDSNLFRGPFPHWICKLRKWLRLSINLSNNRFSGSIPQCLRNFTYFPQALILRNNSFSGTLPVMSADASVNALDFSGNRFCGKIPESIGSLEELSILNLSSNALTSDIPQPLADLKNLEALDLSHNQLFGQIPPDLGKIHSLLTMNFSHNNLEGPIPQDQKFQDQNCSSFMDNPKLYGLEKFCGKTYVSNPIPKEEQVINWIAAAIAYGPGVLCGFVIGNVFISHKFRRINPRVVIRSAR
ncbi:PREDICTED: receptor like protein 30-like [Camelina sativa]|uniref:Receptor like protein 30-like n=1 Tax=Camelina sativa TaxID=90675 RepID=A0ABM1QGM6_CAMSA|nr:PREDICTED: receptor like protein 30-like [Camelina sativa]